MIGEYLDQDAIAVVEGGVPETQALLAERFDHIFYTGNSRVARVVMEAASRHLTPVTLELGGKSPVYVDSSANLDVAARRMAWGKYLNAGQTCIAPDYVLVARELEDRFVEHVRRAIFDFYGPEPKRAPTTRASSTTASTNASRGLLDSGTVAVGGTQDAATRYIAPTVLRDVMPESPVMQEEIFGPILPVLPVDGVDEAIAFVNGREKPLALYVFADSADVAQRVVNETSSGGVARERDAVPRRGTGAAVRRRRPEWHGRVPRQGELRHVQPRQERAAQDHAARSRPGLPAVHQRKESSAPVLDAGDSRGGVGRPTAAARRTSSLIDGWRAGGPHDTMTRVRGATGFPVVNVGASRRAPADARRRCVRLADAGDASAGVHAARSCCVARADEATR